MITAVATAIATSMAVYLRTIALEERNLAIEERKLTFEERKFAYAELFKGTARYWLAKGLEKKAENEKDEAKLKLLEERAQRLYEESDALWRQGRFKVGVLSDAEVVKAFATFYKTPSLEKGECTGDEERMSRDADMYTAMREEMRAKGEVDKRDLALVLFDCFLKESKKK